MSTPTTLRPCLSSARKTTTTPKPQRTVHFSSEIHALHGTHSAGRSQRERKSTTAPTNDLHPNAASRSNANVTHAARIAAAEDALANGALATSSYQECLMFCLAWHAQGDDHPFIQGYLHRNQVRAESSRILAAHLRTCVLPEQIDDYERELRALEQQDGKRAKRIKAARSRLSTELSSWLELLGRMEVWFGLKPGAFSKTPHEQVWLVINDRGKGQVDSRAEGFASNGAPAINDVPASRDVLVGTNDATPASAAVPVATSAQYPLIAKLRAEADRLQSELTDIEARLEESAHARKELDREALNIDMEFGLQRGTIDYLLKNATEKQALEMLDAIPLRNERVRASQTLEDVDGDQTDERRGLQSGTTAHLMSQGFTSKQIEEALKLYELETDPVDEQHLADKVTPVDTHAAPSVSAANASNVSLWHHDENMMRHFQSLVDVSPMRPRSSRPGLPLTRQHAVLIPLASAVPVARSSNASPSGESTMRRFEPIFIATPSSSCPSRPLRPLTRQHAFHEVWMPEARQEYTFDQPTASTGGPLKRKGSSENDETPTKRPRSNLFHTPPPLNLPPPSQPSNSPSQPPQPPQPSQSPSSLSTRVPKRKREESEPEANNSPVRRSSRLAAAAATMNDASSSSTADVGTPVPSPSPPTGTAGESSRSSKRARSSSFCTIF